MSTLRYGTLGLTLAAVAGFMAFAQDMSMAEPTLTVGDHEVLGEFLSDGDGRALYVVVGDDGEPVECTGECAEAWPPLLVDGAMDGESAMRNDGAMEIEGAMTDDGAMGTNGAMTDDSAMAMDGVAGEGVEASLVGTVEREDGTTQLTYDGLPLYYFVNDVEAGEVNCQAVAQFGGTWYVLYGDGEINRTAPD